MNTESVTKALLIVAHGSRRQRSNEEIKLLTQCVARHAGERFSHVGCAFLELAEPSIEAGIDQCVAAGANDITVMPYFLSAGRHVVEDVPGIVKGKQAEYPAINMHFSTYLGASTIMPELIVDTALGDQCLCGKSKQACQYPDCLPEPKKR